MDEDTAAFITVEPGIKSGFCVEVRKWDKTADSYIVSKCSAPLSRVAADALAQSWAATLRLEVR